MFLSGVFFSIDTIPDVLQPIARLLPLSFLATGVREVIVNGVALIEQIPTLIGMLVWLGVALTLAIRRFRWKEVAA
jgi:ABC-2 type transport system permease protein